MACENLISDELSIQIQTIPAYNASGPGESVDRARIIDFGEDRIRITLQHLGAAGTGKIYVGRKLPAGRLAPASGVLAGCITLSPQQVVTFQSRGELWATSDDVEPLAVVTETARPRC